jgi:ABC-type bacteriocin/lantibiotic exporter with double-glycine peptidase domain
MLPEIYFIKLSIIKTTEFYQATEEEITKQNFVNGDINFKNISYSYNNIDDILKNINFTIKEKEHIHLIGSSGTGKSTVCKLLTKEIDNYKGNILINNINIKNYNSNTIHSKIIYISQREKLFSDTIYNNIVLNNKISNKELKKIIDITNLDKITRNKELKLDTYLFDGGYNLSGGERQRIVLARALVQKPKILILDESLSELDEQSELSILKKLDKYYKDTTIIYISHSKTRYFNKTIKIGT